MAGSLSQRTYAVLKVAFVVAGFSFLIWGVVDAWEKTDGGALPSASSAALAALLWVLGLAAGLFGWLALLEKRDVELARGFYISQVGKYVPGAVWQGLGLVKSADDSGIGTRQSGPAYGAFVLTQVVAAVPMALLLVVAPGVEAWARFAAVGGVLLLLLLDRRWMVAALRRIPRLRDVPRISVPSQRRIAESWVANSLSLAFAAVAFYVLLGSVAGSAPFRALGAFAAAWFVGFVVAPVPAGLGLREIVLILLLPDIDPDLVIATSAYHRVISLTVEAVLALGALALWRRRAAPNEPALTEKA